MIARFYILVPFNLCVRQGDHLAPIEFDEGPYRIRIHRPCLAAVSAQDTDALSPVPVNEVVAQLRPGEVQTVTDLVEMDRSPVIRANLLWIDFHKIEFDRRATDFAVGVDALDQGDPPPRVAFEVANRFLCKLRAVTRGSQITKLDPMQSFWRLDYLTDSEELLPLDPALRRRKAANSVQWNLVGINHDVWSKVQLLPLDFQPRLWDELILDAESALPEVGASIALANAAIEAYSEWFIDQIASLGFLPSGLWDWITERPGPLDWFKEPSVSDRFDRLLFAFTNRSLKNEPHLWEAFQNLRTARNSLMHDGKAVVGANAVTPAKAAELITQANNIIAWCDNLLPERQRRPKAANRVEYYLRKNVAPTAEPQ